MIVRRARWSGSAPTPVTPAEIDGAPVVESGPFVCDNDGHLWVGGGDLFGTTGSYGFFAQVEVETGEILNRYGPSDGDPNDQDFVFYSLAFTRKGCRIAAFDSFALFGGPAPLYEAQVCGGGGD